MTVTEGDLATAIWRACLDAGHPVTVPASRHAAATALRALDQPAPMTAWPALMVDLHESLTPGQWANPGHLAAALRRHADLLDRRAHDACVAEAWGTEVA